MELIKEIRDLIEGILMEAIPLAVLFLTIGTILVALGLD
jgi:ABC-type transport system involved in cytochrome c biogenesis permease subunit